MHYRELKKVELETINALHEHLLPHNNSTAFEMSTTKATYSARFASSEVDVPAEVAACHTSVRDVFMDALWAGKKAADGQPALKTVAIAVRFPLPSAEEGFVERSKAVNCFVEDGQLYVKVAVPTSPAGDVYPAGKAVKSSVCVLAYRVSPTDPGKDMEVLAIHHADRNRTELVAGGVESGETQFQAMMREVEEEAGLSREFAVGSKLHLVSRTEFYNEAAMHSDVLETYAVKYDCWGKEDCIRAGGDGQEVTKAMWLPLSRVRELGIESSRNAVERFAKALAEGKEDDSGFLVCKVKTNDAGRSVIRPYY